MRYFIELSYFGKHYHGWQRQPNAVTVQETIEKALSMILRKPVQIMGAGRTDAGVHATQMYAHFDWDGDHFTTQESIEKLTHKFNRLLPKDIAFKRIFQVADKAHTRFDATSRSYVYRIGKEKNPFTSDHAPTVRNEVHIEAMNKAAAILLDYNDFECFSKSNTDVNTYLCDITRATWIETEDEYHFHITANRFLRNMVRAIVGTLLEIGEGKRDIAWMHEVITGKSRSQAGKSVPGRGLYLTEILYPETIYKDHGRD